MFFFFFVFHCLVYFPVVFLVLCYYYYSLFPFSCFYYVCLFGLLLSFLQTFFVFCTPCLRGNYRHFCWLLNAKTLALVLCTLVKFCTLSSPVLVDFCLIWALFLYFCLLFGSFCRSLGSLDHFLRAWGGLGAPGAQKGHFLVTFWSLFERLDPPPPPQEGHFLVTFCKMFSKVRFYVVFW